MCIIEFQFSLTISCSIIRVTHGLLFVGWSNCILRWGGVSCCCLFWWGCQIMHLTYICVPLTKGMWRRGVVFWFVAPPTHPAAPQPVGLRTILGLFRLCMIKQNLNDNIASLILKNIRAVDLHLVILRILRSVRACRVRMRHPLNLWQTDKSRRPDVV